MKSEHVAELKYHKLTSEPADYRVYKWTCLVLLYLLTCSSGIHAQQTTDYTIHANIIYRFTKYIDWPEARKSGVFIIGIVGDSPLLDVMKEFTFNKTVGSQRILIKKLSASADVFNCHILFISEDESNSIKKIAARTAGSPILLVTESDGLALKGSCINFIIVDERLKLEINKGNIDRRSMGIASELLQLGTTVK